MKKLDTANKELIKKINTNAILNVIRSKESISRAQIAKILQLNPATVSSNVADLIEVGLVKEIGSGSSSGGRKPILLELNSDNVYIIGVHTELTHVNIGIVNMNGTVIIKKVYKYKSLKEIDSETVLDTIIKGIHDIIISANIVDNKIIGIGVGLHGLVDPLSGVSVFAPAFHWHHIPIKDILYDEFMKTTIIDNDVRVMALGEKWFGKAKTSDNFMLINLGEGIGGALFINGQLYYGKTFGAGEIGHIRVTRKPHQCACGNTGCLTTVASEEGIIDRINELIRHNKISISGINKEEDITYEKVLEAANAGDTVARRILEQTGEYIGRGIGIIVNVINPERVILTGSVLKAKEYLMEPIRKATESVSIFDNFVKTKISVASIEEDLGVIGASTLILNDLFTV